ncbi:MAG: class F sortase [Acidimicrobiales bacterium]
MLVAGGGTAIGVAATSQYDTPQPSAAAAGSVGPAATTTAPRADRRSTTTTPSERGAVPGPPASTTTTASPSPPTTAVQGPVLPRSQPVSIDIPAIDVQSKLQYLGLNANGTIQVPQPGPLYNEAAWYEYSPTPGQVGPSVIEGHIDSAAEGPSVFFHLGALKPGEDVDVTLADRTVAVFRITGVREYPKASFPRFTVYGNTDYAALRLLTCGGQFDSTTHHYLSNIVVFASLVSSHPATSTSSAA